MISEAWKTAQEKKKPPRNKSYLEFQERYFYDPAGFVRECIQWAKGKAPTPYQLEILGLIPGNKRVSVRGCHGLGKTALAAWLVHWFSLTRDGKDWKVVCTASAWRQLEKYLFPEVHKWARSLDWNKIGRLPYNQNELFVLKLKLDTGEAFAVASDNPALIEGAHAEYILYIYDESKSVPAATFDASEGALSQENAIAIAISTPGEPVGRFYDIQSRKPGYEDWIVRHVKKEEVIAAGLMSAEWAEARRKQWGEKSAIYLNRVEGEFAAQEEDSVIPLSWVEAANERWNILNDNHTWTDFTCLGADIARKGEDRTVLAPRHGLAIRELRVYEKQDTMETVGYIAGILDKYNGLAIVDIIGLGAGVYDRLRELGYQVKAFVASGRTSHRDKTNEQGFVNIRSAAWWNMREILETGEIALPPDDELTGELTAPKWRVMSGAKIRVEEKSEIRDRLERSTDKADAVIMAFWDEMESTTEEDSPLEGYRG